MPIMLTVETFLNGLRQSGLIEPDQLETMLRELPDELRMGPDAADFANAFVERGCLTPWQVETLLQGKFTGFVLGHYRLLQVHHPDETRPVYLAEDTRSKRRCLLTILPGGGITDAASLRRLDRIVETVIALDHPNVVRVYDIGHADDEGREIHFLALEHVEGQDLEQILKAGPPLSPIRAANLIRQAAEGLASLHGNGLLHGDIRPGHLLVDNNGTVKLLAPGLHPYLDPEGGNSRAVDEPGEIGDLGRALLAALTGRLFDVERTSTPGDPSQAVEVSSALEQAREDVPESLVAIVAKMMAERKEDRYQTARAVARALSEWLVEHGDEAWRSRHPEVVVAVAGLEGLRSAASPETKSARHIRTEEELLPEVVDKPHGQSTEAQRTPPVDTVKVTPSETPVQTPAVPAADVMSVLSPTSGRIRNDLSPGNLPAAAPQRLDPVSHAQLVLHWSQPAERGWTRLLTIPGLLGIALAIIGVLLVGGMGYSLYARAKAPAPVEIEAEPLESLDDPPRALPIRLPSRDEP